MSLSYANAIKNKNSLLYPHVYSYELFERIKKMPVFYGEQIVDRDKYNWVDDEEVLKIRKSLFPENSYVILISGKMSINNYPSSL